MSAGHQEENMRMLSDMSSASSAALGMSHATLVGCLMYSSSKCVTRPRCVAAAAAAAKSGLSLGESGT